MKQITIFVATLIFVNVCNSKPLTEGLEYRCITTAIKRINGNNVQDIKVPPNAKPFHISEKNNTLQARYKESPSTEVAGNNSILVKAEVANDQGRKFDVAIYKKSRSDGETEIHIFKEINGKTAQINMTIISKYTDTTSTMRMNHVCE